MWTHELINRLIYILDTFVLAFMTKMVSHIFLNLILGTYSITILSQYSITILLINTFYLIVGVLVRISKTEVASAFTNMSTWKENLYYSLKIITKSAKA